MRTRLHCVSPILDRIQVCTAAWSTRYMKSLPRHHWFNPNELTATIVFVESYSSGPPESPPHVPPFPLPGFAVVWMLKPSVRWLFRLISCSVAISRLRNETVLTGLDSERPYPE